LRDPRILAEATLNQPATRTGDAVDDRRHCEDRFEVLDVLDPPVHRHDVCFGVDPEVVGVGRRHRVGPERLADSCGHLVVRGQEA
jgi:hypothetical protein